MGTSWVTLKFVVRYVDVDMNLTTSHTYHSIIHFLSALFLFLVFVTLSTSTNKKQGSNNGVQKDKERKSVYTYRLKKIRKVCKKYGLSASDKGKIPITKSQIIQSEFTTPPFNDKVNFKQDKVF